MQIDKRWLGKTALQKGFVRETLALKGGTAINLTVFNLPKAVREY